MANDYTGRIWKITGAGTPTFGTLNIKIKGGSWTGGTAGNTFTITDVAGRTYTSTWSASSQQITLGEMGWLSGPVTFGGTFTGEVDLFIGTK